MTHIARHFLTALLLAAALPLAGCACGCRSANTGMPPSPAAISHVVLFNLQDPADADELIADCNERLAPIPGIASFAVGRHLDTGRSHVFSDYHVGLYVGYESEADYDVYIDHPDHVALVEKWQPRWNWIRIYDFFEE